MLVVVVVGPRVDGVVWWLLVKNISELQVVMDHLVPAFIILLKYRKIFRMD